MKRVDIVTNMAPHYRACLWRTILQSEELESHFVFSQSSSSSIQQIDFSQPAWEALQNRLHYVRNLSFRGVVFWQLGVLRHALRSSADVFVLLDQMYTLSTWLVVLIARLRRRKVVFWGHGFYGNETGLKRFVRLWFLRRADAWLLYGPRAKALLSAQGFDEYNLRVFYNSLDYERQSALRASSLDDNYYRDRAFFSDPSLPTIIYVGRLTPQKKLESAIQAIDQLSGQQHPVNFIMVGDGPMRQALEELPSKLNRCVYFFGSCYDETVLSKLIANADLCLSPGEVGLTAIHALTYGTPVCTHNDYSNQMPEVEALQPGQTGVFFDRSKMNIAEAISGWFDSNPDRQLVRMRCYKMVDDFYNPHRQLQTLTELISELTSAR